MKIDQPEEDENTAGSTVMLPGLRHRPLWLLAEQQMIPGIKANQEGDR